MSPVGVDLCGIEYARGDCLLTKKETKGQGQKSWQTNEPILDVKQYRGVTVK